MPCIVTFDPNSISKQSDIIPDATEKTVGVVSLAQIKSLIPPPPPPPPPPVSLGVEMPVYSKMGDGAPERPDADQVGAVQGVKTVMIWELDGKEPNFSDGVDWYNAIGALT